MLFFDFTRHFTPRYEFLASMTVFVILVTIKVIKEGDLSLG